LPLKYKEGRIHYFDATMFMPVLEKIRVSEFLPAASQFITLLINAARYEQNTDLRLDALQLLSQFLFDNLQEMNVLATVFPGIASSLCATISQKGENENHKVICSAFQVLGDLITSVFSDNENETSESVSTSLRDMMNVGIAAKANQRRDEQLEPTLPPLDEPATTKRRDKEWYKVSKERLLNVMSQIFKIRLYPDWRSRRAIIEFSYQVISLCSRTLDNCVQSLIEIMVLHADDAYTEVSTVACLRMQELLSKQQLRDVTIPVLKEGLYDWVLKFPQYMISKDEQEKSIAMSLIAGYVLLLNEKAENVLESVLLRVSDGWMTALEIDKNSLNVLEDQANPRLIELKRVGDDNPSTPIYPKVRFRYIVNDYTVAKLTRVLNVIGRYCNLQNWIGHFMQYISIESGDVCNDPQAGYIVHSLLAGASFSDHVDDTALWIDSGSNGDDGLQTLTLQVLHTINDSLTNSISNSRSKAVISNQINPDLESSNILAICFGLQVVGLAASILEKDCLQEELITLLYPLLAHLGSTNVYIHTYALITLDTIALVCGENSAQDLCIKNIDYIINMISQRISLLTNNVRAPIVLKALIHIGGPDTLIYLNDSIQEIYDALDRYHMNDWLCRQLCDVLFEVIQTIINTIETVNDGTEGDGNESDQVETVSAEIMEFISNKEDIYDIPHDSGNETIENIGKFFLDRQEQGKHDNLTLANAVIDSGINMDESSQEETTEEAAGEEAAGEEAEVPRTYEQKMAKTIMEKTSHFLTAPSEQLRSRTLSLLASGIKVLQLRPNDVNQLVHEIWPSIVNRLDDTQNYVVFNAAMLIEKISQVSTDYLSTKFINDIWPRYKKVLRRATTLNISDTVNYSVYSLYHKTQSCVLKTLTQIAVNVPIQRTVLMEILHETKYFLNSQAHEQLQSSCRQLFKVLASQQPDIVWLCEYALLGKESILKSPSTLLDSFEVPEWMKSLDQDSQNNAQLLLQN
jgi:hypothetical protein